VSGTPGMLAAAQARLDDVLNAPLKARAPTEHHLMLRAKTITATDRGDFVAVVSSEAVDREKDVVSADAMVKALKAWIEVDKLIPLLWSHSPAAEDVVGHIDPESARAVNGEVVVEGWIDQSTSRGKEAWRLVKSNVLGFSFGYLVNKASKMPDGTRLITKLDVFEVSCTATPMNGTTRVLAWKSRNPSRARREDPNRVPSQAELLAREVELGLEGALTNLEDGRHMVAPRTPSMAELAEQEAAALAGLPFIARIRDRRASSLDAAVERMREQTRDEMLRVLSSGDTGKAYRPRPGDEQRARANQMAAEFELERALSFDPRA
jgi:HK97 family phage prohead protease